MPFIILLCVIIVITSLRLFEAQHEIKLYREKILEYAKIIDSYVIKEMERNQEHDLL